MAAGVFHDLTVPREPRALDSSQHEAVGKETRPAADHPFRGGHPGDACAWTQLAIRHAE